MIIATQHGMARTRRRALPYAADALEPEMSRAEVEFHHGRYHLGIAGRLDALLEGTRWQDAPLEEIMRRTGGPLREAAVQVWNHDFYWSCLAPDGGCGAIGGLRSRLRDRFGSLEDFRLAFRARALGRGSPGWVWLVKTGAGDLELQDGGEGDSPLRGRNRPLLGCDVSEHAYCIDYGNDRGAYLDAFWSLVDWRYVERNFFRPRPAAGWRYSNFRRVYSSNEEKRAETRAGEETAAQGEGRDPGVDAARVFNR